MSIFLTCTSKLLQPRPSPRPEAAPTLLVLVIAVLGFLVPNWSEAAQVATTTDYRLGLEQQRGVSSQSAAGTWRWLERAWVLVRALFLACGQPPPCCVCTWPFLGVHASEEISSLLTRHCPVRLRLTYGLT